MDRNELDERIKRMEERTQARTKAVCELTQNLNKQFDEKLDDMKQWTISENKAVMSALGKLENSVEDLEEK